ncbi:MAG: serine/threonine protein kinase [Ignavibacteriae bacterium HGW-Ignavibacteriae-3]|nr:MAG: serine/threonine protein kinase [Ignavibacteriae bacterium HGW-Ignavibacteriae-3]
MSYVSNTPENQFITENKKQWKSFLQKLFSDNIPETQVWTDKNDIIYILQRIGSMHNMNHLFLPHFGGLDLTGCQLSHEEGCIELVFGERVYVVKPATLTFNSFGSDEYGWAYFRLETNTLKPTGVYDSLFSVKEELTEISPLEYVNRSVWDDRYYGYDENGDSKPFPNYVRLVTRLLSGSVVIFAKSSLYNANPDTYDARHNKMSAVEFHEHIEAAIESMKGGS